MRSTASARNGCDAASKIAQRRSRCKGTVSQTGLAPESFRRFSG